MTMTTKGWRDLVARGRELASDDRGATRFELGDCALEAEPMGADGKRTGSTETLAEYAHEIGVAFNTLRDYRSVASAWPADARASAGLWAVHRALIAEPDRFELIQQEPTVAEVNAIKATRRKRKVGIGRSDAWWEAEKEALKRLRGFDEMRMRGLPKAEAKRRAEALREHATLIEQAAEILDNYSYVTRL